MWYKHFLLQYYLSYEVPARHNTLKCCQYGYGKTDDLPAIGSTFIQLLHVDTYVQNPFCY